MGTPPSNALMIKADEYDGVAWRRNPIVSLARIPLSTTMITILRADCEWVQSVQLGPLLARCLITRCGCCRQREGYSRTSVSALSRAFVMISVLTLAARPRCSPAEGSSTAGCTITNQRATLRISGVGDEPVHLRKTFRSVDLAQALAPCLTQPSTLAEW